MVPVSDVDRAKAFYADGVGFHVDHDTRVGDEARVAQLTPPGSGCSIVIGEGGVPDMPPGSLKGLQVVGPDVHAARRHLAGRGVEVSDVQVLGESPTPQPDPLDNVGFVFFSDPDGNRLEIYYEIPDALQRYKDEAQTVAGFPGADVHCFRGVIMNRCLILLAVLACYTATPESLSRTGEAIGPWSDPVNVASLNTEYNDMYAVLSKDELTVYFTSDRPDPTSIGGDDLWFATRESVDAPWGPAHNMGEPINSSVADSLPMLSYDEHVMFFYSTRPGGCGLGDIWMARRHDARSQAWEPPTNLGCVLNTAATEIAPAFFEHPETEEITLFYGSNRPGSQGFDVYASAVGEDGYFGPGVLVPEFSSAGRR